MSLIGKPLLAHSIEYAQQCNAIQAVFVSTDDEAIADVAKGYGAKVIMRNETLSNDTAKSSDSLRHAVEEIALLNVAFDAVVLLQTTSPFRPAELLDNCINKFEESLCDSLFTVSTVKRKLGEIRNNMFYPLNYEFEQRSQDLSACYFENGLVYIVKKEVINQGLIFTPQTFPFVIDGWESTIDIDTLDDFEYASYLFHKHEKQ